MSYFQLIIQAMRRTRRWCAAGVRRDGTLVARKCEVWLDTGAYPDVGRRVVQKAGYTAAGPYRLPHVQIDTYAVYSNPVNSVAFRGYGLP